MALKGLTEAELEKGKTYLIGSYPLRFDTSVKIASQLVHIQLEGRSARLARRAQPADRRGDRGRASSAPPPRAFGDGSLYTTVVGKPEGF